MFVWLRAHAWLKGCACTTHSMRVTCCVPVELAAPSPGWMQQSIITKQGQKHKAGRRRAMHIKDSIET